MLGASSWALQGSENLCLPIGFSGLATSSAQLTTLSAHLATFSAHLATIRSQFATISAPALYVSVFLLRAPFTTQAPTELTPSFWPRAAHCKPALLGDQLSDHRARAHSKIPSPNARSVPRACRGSPKGVLTQKGGVGNSAE